MDRLAAPCLLDSLDRLTGYFAPEMVKRPEEKGGEKLGTLLVYETRDPDLDTRS